MKGTEELKSKQIEEYIRENLYSKVDGVSWSRRNMHWKTILNKDAQRREFINPKCNAMLFMAKYYELKYGIKIIVVRQTEDLQTIRHLVEESEKSKHQFKFGFILPNVDSVSLTSFQDFSDLKGKLIYDYGHVCPVIYEKLADGRSSLIVLDSTGMNSIEASVHKLIIGKIATGLLILLYTNKIVLQSSDNGCRDLAVLMLKDALRMSNIVDELGLKSVKYFDILPEQLLKYFQTGSPNKTLNRELQVLRSSPTKPTKSLGQYRDQNQNIIYLENGDKIQDSLENTKLLDENELMVQRIVRLCEFYKVSSEDDIKSLLQKIYDENIKFPVILPENLPSWSHALEWRFEESVLPTESIFAGVEISLDDKYNYQFICFIARNLQFKSQPKGKRAAKLLNPFLGQVQEFCLQFIDKYFDQHVYGICVLVKLIGDDLKTKFIKVINEELKTDLVFEDFVYEESYKLRQALKMLDFSEETDPLKEIIVKSNLFDEYPGALNKQVENLCKAVARFLQKDDPDDPIKLHENILEHRFIRLINGKLKENNPNLHIKLADFNGSGSDNLKNALRLLGCDDGNKLIEELLQKSAISDLVNLYRNLFPLELYQRCVGKNLMVNLDKRLYQKIIRQDVLEDTEVVDIVHLMSRNIQLNENDYEFESTKNIREIFQKIQEISKITINFDFGKHIVESLVGEDVSDSRSESGIESFSSSDLKRCLKMAYKVGNQEVIKVIHKHLILPEDLFFIQQRDGGLKKDSEEFDKMLSEYLKEDPNNFNKLFNKAQDMNDMYIQDKLNKYKELHAPKIVSDSMQDSNPNKPSSRVSATNNKTLQIVRGNVVDMP